MKKESKRFPEVSCDAIDELAGGYRGAQMLFAAVRLDLFSVIGEKSIGVRELKGVLKVDSRALRMLCDGLVGFGILKKENNKYSNEEIALECLTTKSPSSKIALLHLSARQYDGWGQLYDVLKSAKVIEKQNKNSKPLGDAHDFAHAMMDVSRKSAVSAANLLDLSDVKQLLDVGGGPGLYSIEFARQNPELNAVVFDTEETLLVASENISEARLGERVSIFSGDIFGKYPADSYDFVFLSNVVHMYSFEDNMSLIQNCAKVLRPGGRLCIKDFVLESDRTKPLGAAVFSITMLLNTKGGDCYTLEEIESWFTDAGLKLSNVEDLAGQSKLVVAQL